MIKSKLQIDVLLQMELLKASETEWIVESLRICLGLYVVAHKRTELDPNPNV